MYKDVLFDQQVREKILEGINITAKAVSSTLGPRGQNVIFEETMYPTITKDGVTVAQQIFLEDKFQNMGVMIAREAAENTNREAGDGTTTTVVLLSSIANEGNQYIVAGMNPILIKKGMDYALTEVNKYLDSVKKDVKTDKEKLQIATISANNDLEIGELISGVIKKTGENGIVSITNSNSIDTVVEYVKGTKIDSGYENHIFMNDPRRLAAVIEEPSIIITTDKVDSQQQLVPIIQKMIGVGKTKMVLFADKIEGQALAFLIQNYLQGKFTCIPVRMPSFGNYKKDVIYDLAKLTEATVLGEEEIVKLIDGDESHVGTCETITAYKDYTVIAGGNGDIKDRVTEIKSLLDNEKDDIFNIEKLKERLGKLTGAIANIKVGGASDTEQAEKKYRIEDALNATIAAIEEGIVEGGGCALLRASESLRKSFGQITGSKEFLAGIEIIIEALRQPLNKIVENSGKSGEVVAANILNNNIGYNALTDEYENLIDAGIMDPVKVVKNEIQNSISTAGMILTSGCAIALKSEDKK